MKKLLLIFVACIIGISVTGCVGSSHNLSDEEIIERIQTKMKKEFDKLNFTVDFNQYEFKVNVTQSFGEVGKVTVKDKRYNYDPIVVYDGSFGNTDKNIGLDQEKIGTNPVIFVYHGYLNYLDEMSKETHQFVQKYLDERGIKYKRTPFDIREFSGRSKYYTTSLEVKDGKAERNQIARSESFLWSSPKISDEMFLQFFNIKSNSDFNYQLFDELMYKGVLYVYPLENHEDYLLLENEINQMKPQQRVYIQLGR